MIKDIFFEIIKEAENGKIKLQEELYSSVITYYVFLKFYVNKNKDNEINLIIKNEDTFFEKLESYVKLSLIHYNKDFNYINVKHIITMMFSNISNYDTYDLENFLDIHIKFLEQSKLFKNKSKYINDDIGYLVSSISKQSMNQETPFCFKSRFEKDDTYYNLPRISFGISDDICYIYAVQNKDKNVVTDYNLEYVNIVKNNIRKVNKSINKYRNVTPSFVVSLATFINEMKKCGINKFVAVTNLPLRVQNRDTVTKHKIETKSFTLKEEELEKFKEDLTKNNIRNNNQATKGFENLINRIKIHFYDSMNIIPSDIDGRIYFEIEDLITKSEFLKLITEEQEKKKIK